MSLLTVIAIGAAGIFLLVARAYLGSRHRLPLPPGPKPWPIIGNLLDVPAKYSWVEYSSWAKQYGDVMSIQVLGKVIIILNSTRDIHNLLEKRSSIYSDRPVVPFMDLSGVLHWALSLMRYGDKWRAGRRLVTHSLRPSSAEQYRPMQRAKAHKAVKRILEDPSRFADHIAHFTGSVIMSLVYGYDVKEGYDRYVELAEMAVRVGGEANTPGAFLANDFPILCHLPAWFPGMRRFHSLVNKERSNSREMIEGPFSFVKKGMEEGTARPSFVLEHLTRSDGRPEEITLAEVAASLYGAGTHTTGSVLRSFLFALCVYPEVQRKAQADVDRVVGRSRLPDYEDRPSLPYISALCQELMRWRVAMPLVVPHALTEDDVYDGRFMPKGSIVFANTWSVLHDPAAYPDPETFIPERFINKTGELIEDPIVLSSFGYGRRKCPGWPLADANIWIFVASFLSVINVSNGTDARGSTLTAQHPYTNNIVCEPEPFKCSFTLRDKKAEELIRLATAE